jgi:hypothetical protein
VTVASGPWRRRTGTFSSLAMPNYRLYFFGQLGSIRIWAVYLLAAALGLVNVFDTPARQALIPELVPVDHLANAVTLNSVTVNLARIAGAALGGALVAALGVALCFYCNACSFLLVVVALLLMRADQVRPSDVDLRRRGQLREAFRYVASCPELLLPLLAVTVVGALAWQGTTPLGGPLIGWIGARWSLLAGGLPTVAVGALALPTLVAGRRAEARSHRPPASDA